MCMTMTVRRSSLRNKKPLGELIQYNTAHVLRHNAINTKISLKRPWSKKNQGHKLAISNVYVKFCFLRKNSIASLYFNILAAALP